MSSCLSRAAIVALAAMAFAAGCGGSSSTTTVSPTQSGGIDFFVGNWSSGSTLGGGTPSGCSKFDYTVSKIDATSGNVSYDVVCSGYSIKGTGTGVLQASVLKWNASGTVAAGGTTCDFAFTDDTATPQGDNQILVTYNAKVCGISFSGSQVLQRK